jgi:hypothetical protein
MPITSDPARAAVDRVEGLPGRRRGSLGRRERTLAIKYRPLSRSGRFGGRINVAWQANPVADRGHGPWCLSAAWAAPPISLP